jgi:hypothetical protein
MNTDGHGFLGLSQDSREVKPSLRIRASEVAPAFALRVLQHRYNSHRAIANPEADAPSEYSGGQPHAVQTLRESRGRV